MAVDPHTSQIQGFFDGPVDPLVRPLPILAEYVGKNVDRERLTIVSPMPDGAGGRAVDRRPGSPLAIIHKRRDRTCPTRCRSRGRR